MALYLEGLEQLTGTLRPALILTSVLQGIICPCCAQREHDSQV